MKKRYTKLLVLIKQVGATLGAVLDLPVKICQYRADLLWYPVIPESMDDPMRIHNYKITVPVVNSSTY
jgi:hypothetical protein